MARGGRRYVVEAREASRRRCTVPHLCTEGATGTVCETFLLESEGLGPFRSRAAHPARDHGEAPEHGVSAGWRACDWLRGWGVHV